jgi:hypothetical protein
MPSGSATGETAPTLKPVCFTTSSGPPSRTFFPPRSALTFLKSTRLSPEITTMTGVSSTISRIVFAIWPTWTRRVCAASSELCVDSSKEWISLRSPLPSKKAFTSPAPRSSIWVRHLHAPGNSGFAPSCW